MICSCSLTARAPAASSRSASAVPDAALQQLTAQMNEMRVSVEGLEKERDFYFNKVRLGARDQAGS
jgi:RP/EB family microtubule-associated protein